MSNVILLLSHGGEWKTMDDGGRMYVNGRSMGIEVMKDITHQQLLQLVYKTLNLDPSKINIELTCRYFSSLPTQEVLLNNDEQVRLYVEYNIRSFPYIVSLCVIESKSSRSQRSSPSTVNSGTDCNQVNSFLPSFMPTENRQVHHCASTSSTRLNQDPPHVTMPTNVCNETCNDAYNNDDLDDDDHNPNDDIRVYSEEHVNVEDGCNNQQEEVQLPEQPNDHLPQNGNPIGNTVKPTIMRALDFRYLPPIPDPPDGPSDVDSFSSDAVHKGQIFKSKKELQDTLAMHAIRNNYQYKSYKSTKIRFEVKCIDDTCKWRVRATCLPKTEYFQVKKIDSVHSCSRDQVPCRHRQASARLLGRLIKSKYEGREYGL